MAKINDCSLYLVISEEYSIGIDTLKIAEEAVHAGIDILQMREKNKTKDELVKLGKKLSSLCKASETIFIVNDNPTLANEVEADGVHLGQEDIIKHPIKVSRELVGSDGIIGISTHSVEQFKIANDMDVDYIAFGPLFPTRTKDYSIGTNDIEKVLSIAVKPVVFIGGINLENIDEVLSKGAKNIAVIREIVQSDNIPESVDLLKKKINSV